MSEIQGQYSVENAQSQMRKGFLEFPVLLIVGSEPTYVPDILEQLKKADLLVVEGTLYPLLSRLKRYGILEYDWQESKSGPPRKIYRLTKEGEEILEKLETAWNTFDSSINKLIKTYEKSN